MITSDDDGISDRPSSPEERLLAAILGLTLADIAGAGQEESRQATRWVNDQDGTCPLYCDLLGIDYLLFVQRAHRGHVRATIDRMRQQGRRREMVDAEN